MLLTKDIKPGMLIKFGNCAATKIFLVLSKPEWVSNSDPAPFIYRYKIKTLTPSNKIEYIYTCGGDSGLELVEERVY